MSHPAVASVSRVCPAGAWRLHQGQAMSLSPQEASLLRIHRGRVWVTLGAPGALSPQASGDRFVQAGESLVVPPGARLVMEPLAPHGATEPVCFDWAGAPAPQATGRFGREVLAPMHELAGALELAGVALARVLRGVVGYSEFLVAGRGRVLSPLESMRS
jgi:Protein of unknown function (DUF2917)